MTGTIVIVCPVHRERICTYSPTRSDGGYECTVPRSGLVVDEGVGFYHRDPSDGDYKVWQPDQQHRRHAKRHLYCPVEGCRYHGEFVDFYAAKGSAAEDVNPIVAVARRLPDGSTVQLDLDEIQRRGAPATGR